MLNRYVVPGGDQIALHQTRNLFEADANAIQNVEPKPDHIILLLGTGDSGKSTLYRQLRILFGARYTPGEMKAFASIIQTMVIGNAYRMVQALSNPQVREFIGADDLTFGKQAQDAIYTMAQWTSKPPKVLTPELAKLLAEFWADPTTKKIYECTSVWRTISQSSCFLDKVEEMANPNWLPTESDLVNYRIRTTGILDQKILLQTKNFRVVDVGGQRSERRKWIKLFTDVSVILFVVATSEYDQKSWEDSTLNRLDDSKKVFGDICSTRELIDADIFIFFNKMDIFRNHLTEAPFGNYVSDYQGDGSIESCIAYLKREYLAIATTAFDKIGCPKRLVKCYFTTAIDPISVKDAIIEVSKYIIGGQTTVGTLGEVPIMIPTDAAPDNPPLLSSPHV